MDLPTLVILTRFMVTELWKLPGPSSARFREELHKLGGRECLLTCMFDSDGTDSFHMTFEGVESFKATYHRACNGLMIEAYDRIVNVGSTPWLEEVSTQLSQQGEDNSGLQHLMFYFDDGPCYEFICRSFQAGQLGESVPGRKE